jgi:NAD(P)-dependent dehydrogenase (short-subunit alcohol dehydrogenase family)
MGREIARWLAVAGAAVVPAARSFEALTALADWIRRRGAPVLPLTVDVSSRRQCEAAVEKTAASFGRIDALVNNAGVIEPVAPLADTDPDAWSHNLAVNLLGPYYLIRAALPHLRRARGRLVDIGTGASEKAIEGWSAYCAAKAGLAHLTRVVAAETREITAVSFRPGVVDTDMQAQIRREGPAGMTPEKAAYFQRLKAEGKLLPPAQPARAAAWLALHAPASWSGEQLEFDDPRIGTDALEGIPEHLE